jgi:hypothetical protein
MKKFLRIAAVVIALIGLSLFPLSSYIADQVQEGKEKISKGENQVNTLRGGSALSPYTKDVGGIFADSGQKKIDAGKQKVTKYEALVSELKIYGLLAILLGALLFGISFVLKRKNP